MAVALSRTTPRNCTRGGLRSTHLGLRGRNVLLQRLLGRAVLTIQLVHLHTNHQPAPC